METKDLAKSRTFWVALAGAAVNGIAEGSPELMATLTQFGSENASTIFNLVLVAAVAYFRKNARNLSEK